STLQRMYRHLYFRVCDILNTATLIESRAVDYTELRAGADRGGIWAGVATFLVIVSNYLEQYRGAGLELPADVVSSALFGAEKLFARGRFLYFPVVPQGLALYTRQLARTVLRGDVPATASDRKSRRLNSSHLVISYAVFCLKKKTGRRGA